MCHQNFYTDMDKSLISSFICIVKANPQPSAAYFQDRPAGFTYLEGQK